MIFDKPKNKFFYVSKRGRAAYLILCFEESLKLFYKESLQNWGWLLKELWNITSTNDIDEWVSRICDAAPGTFLSYSTYQEVIEKTKEIAFWYELNETEFTYLHELYDHHDPHFLVVASLYDKICDVIILDWGELEKAYTPVCLRAIEDAENILRENGIPFPQNQQAIEFILKHKNKHYGAPFDGYQFSILNRAEN